MIIKTWFERLPEKLPMGHSCTLLQVNLMQQEIDELRAENRAMKTDLIDIEDDLDVCSQHNVELMTELAEIQIKESVELVLTFNFNTLVKVVFHNQVLYEVDLSPMPYFQVCWAYGWGGAYASEEDARDECISLCGYGRSIREVKPCDDGYVNPISLVLTEKRIPLYLAAGAK